MSTKAIIPVIRDRISVVSVGVEIGCFKGELSEALLATFPNLTLHCVDPWEDLEGYDEGGYIADSNQGQFDKWFEVFKERTDRFGDRRVIHRATSTNAAEQVRGSLKFAFIDGDHSYESAKNDIFKWAPKLKQGGLLCGHDYDKGWPGVYEAVNECVGEVNVVSGTSVWWKVWA